MKEYLQNCRICPRNCGVDRYISAGFCDAGVDLRINLAQLHYGEEPVISGSRGSGTIFFSHCNLKCVFCQNYSISQEGYGSYCSPEDLSDLMLDLQQQGAHNINLVTPTHYSLIIREALQQARKDGLILPVVWNSNAYESVDTLAQMEGLVDIYLPDFKYSYAAYSKLYSSAPDYPEIALAAICEMKRQVGDMLLDEEGIATRGIIIRLLVLPNNIAGIQRSLDLIAQNLGTQTQLSLMGQYYPTHKAFLFPELSRGITSIEYDKALDSIHAHGFTNVWTQELSCNNEWTPDFNTNGDMVS